MVGGHPDAGQARQAGALWHGACPGISPRHHATAPPQHPKQLLLPRYAHPTTATFHIANPSFRTSSVGLDLQGLDQVQLGAFDMQCLALAKTQNSDKRKRLNERRVKKMRCDGCVS